MNLASDFYWDLNMYNMFNKDAKILRGRRSCVWQKILVHEFQ